MKRLSVATLHTKWAFTLCLLAAGAQMAAQNPQTQMPSKPGFENDQVVVDPPQTHRGLAPATPEPAFPSPARPCLHKTGQDAVRTTAWHNHRLNRVVIRYYPGSEDLLLPGRHRGAPEVAGGHGRMEPGKRVSLRGERGMECAVGINRGPGWHVSRNQEAGISRQGGGYRSRPVAG